MRHLIFLILAYSVVIEFTFIETANAQVLSSYYISLSSYFSLIPAFPITVPQKEEAGDVYSQPGRIFARKADCFAEIAADVSETYFPSSIIVEGSNIAAQVAGDRSAIAKAAVDAGTRIQSTVVVSFGENGKIMWHQLLERNLLASLGNSDNNECRDRILRRLRSPADDISSVPWIIQSVWYATVNLSYQTSSAVDASAKAQIDAQLSPLKANGSINTEQRSGSLLIANTGKVAFPVAWRPAFISFEHYTYMNQLLDQGWFRYLMYKLDLKKSDREILEILQKDFNLEPRKVPQPKDIVGNMSQGKAIPFDQENEKHLAYLKEVNALYGLAQAIYGDGGAK